MADKNKISIFVYVSILINLIVLALFITFVFGLKKDAFDVDTKKLDRNALICQNSIVNLVKDYDERLNKIVESYPFINLLQQVILNGIDTAERDKIISIFRSGNYPFDTVALYLADGKSVFSSPVKTKPVDLEYYKNSKSIAFFDKDYDGVYFVKPIKNDRGIEVGYIVASVFKKIFENTSYNLNFVVLSNGVVYYNPSIDINSISIDSLTQYMNKDIGGTGTIEADNNTFAFYSGKVKDIDNFSVGILELNVPIVQKYLKYIILALLSLSFIFLLASSLAERFKPAANNITDETDDDEDIYDESEPPINNYANSNIVNDEEFNIDDYDNDIEGLDDESIKYLNKRDKITKSSKVDLPNIDEVEDIKVENDIPNLDNLISYNDDQDNDVPNLDDVLEDGGETLQDDNAEEDEEIKLEDLSSLNQVLEDEEESDSDESIKLEDVDNLDNVLEENQDDDVPNLDDVIEENEEDESIKLEDVDNLDNVLEENQDDDVPNLDDVLEENKEDESIKLEDVDNLDNVLEENQDDDVPNLDDVLEENKEDESIKLEDIDNLDNVLEENQDDDVPNLDDVLEENKEEDESIKLEDVDNLDNVLEENQDDDVPNLDDVLEENKEDESIKLEDVDNLDNVLEENQDDDVPNLDDVLEENKEDESIKLEDVDNLDNVLEENQDDDVPNLDDVLEENKEEADNNTEDEKKDDELEMKDYSDDELLDPDNILDDDEENNIDDTVEDLDDIPNLDDVIEEADNNTEEEKKDDELEMKDYSDDELLDPDNISDDEENNIDDTIEDLDDIPNLDDVIEEAQENNEDENKDDKSNTEESSDDELLNSDNISDDEESNEEENNIDDTVEDLDDIPNLDDVIEEADNNNEDEKKDDELEMKDYSDDELLDPDNILDDDEENNIDDTIEDLDDIPNLDDVIEEAQENNEDDIKNPLEDLEDIPNLDDVLNEDDEPQSNSAEEEKKDDELEMKDYSDDELLDPDNILDDEEESNEEENNIDDTVEDLDDIPNLDDVIDESEEPEEELEESIEDNNSEDNDIIKSIDDIIDDNNEGDILISHGSILEDEIVKKEEEYFSSSDAFNFSLNRDFLLGDYDDEEAENNNSDNSNVSPNFTEEYDDGEVVKPASEKDSFDTEDLIDKELYDPEEVPKVPDDFYKEAEERVKENMTSNWKKVLKALRGKKFINKNMNEMLEWVKEQSGLDIVHAAMLTRQDSGNYEIEESQNISDDTKNKLSISENEALFKKILSHKKTLYVSDPFASDSIKSKFDNEDRKDISHMIFVPIENDEGGLKSFFIGLSSN